MRCSFALLSIYQSSSAIYDDKSKMAPRIYATSYEDTARMVLVVVAAYMSIRVNKHKKERVCVSKGDIIECNNSWGEDNN